MDWLFTLLCLCALHFSYASRGNPNPGMLKLSHARMRFILGRSALRERTQGICKPPDFKNVFDKVIPKINMKKLPGNAGNLLTVNSMNVMVRKVNSGQWVVGRKFVMNEDDANLKMVVMEGGHRAADAQKILDKSIFTQLFGKGMGDLDFIHDTRRRESEFKAVKAKDIEYGYQLDPNSPVFSLQQFAAKPPALKIQPVAQICIGDLLTPIRRKKVRAVYPANLLSGIDRLIDTIIATPSPTLLVSSNGSAEMGLYDKRRSICFKAGGAVVLTPMTRRSAASKSVDHLRNSLYVRISNLHYLTAEPVSPELAPGLTGLVLSALVLDRFKQRHLEPPASLRVQVQSDLFTFLSDLRNSEQLLDPNEVKGNQERNKLSMSYLAQRLFVNQTLLPTADSAAEPVPISTYLACEPTDIDHPEK